MQTIKPTKPSLMIHILSISSIATLASIVSCTTTAKKMGDPATTVNSAETGAGTASPSAASIYPDDLPQELKEAKNFDPAITLDQKTIEESDFYQVRKMIEQNKQALDAQWQEQERLESTVKSAALNAEQRKAALAKQEEDERERKRLKDIEEFEASKGKRAKDEIDAQESTKKLPTIQRSESSWQGLEN